MLKILQPGLSNMWTVNFQMFKVDLQKAEEPEIKLPTSIGSSKKQESSRKTSISALLTMPKPLTMWIATNCGKFFKRRISDHPTCFLRNLFAAQKQQLEPDMEQQTGSKSGKEYVKAVYCHPAYLTYLQSTSWEMLSWRKLESRLLGEIHRWHYPYGRKRRRIKEPLDESERGKWNIWLNLPIQKMKIMAFGPITSWQIDGETVSDFIFWVQNHCKWWLHPWN